MSMDSICIFFSPRASREETGFRFLYYQHNAWGLEFSLYSMDLEVNFFCYGSGTAVEVSPEDIEKTVKQIFEENMKTILEQRYRTSG